MIAIDFGTSNSSAVILRDDGPPQLQALEFGDPDSYDPNVLPSVICNCRNLECRVQAATFGHEALRHSFGLSHDSQLLQEMKLFFDRSTTEPPQLVESSVLLLREEGGFLTPIRKRVLQPHYEGEVPLTPAEFVPGTGKVISEVIKRAGGVAIAQEPLVMGVPASFGNVGAKRLREARARASGRTESYKNLSLYYEPVAAARAYRDLHPGNVLVLDYGGGTLDISVIPITGHSQFNPKDIHFGGFPEGGSRMDEALLNYALAKGDDNLIEWYGGQRVRTKLRIKRDIERAKILLSTTKEALVEFPGAPVDHVQLNQQDLAFALQPIMARMVAKVTQVVIDAVDKIDNIHFVVMSGGSSLCSTVQNNLLAVFQHLGNAKFVVPDPRKPEDVETCLCAVANPHYS
jgi:molecular chaperone DnaK (HSP70)